MSAKLKWNDTDFASDVVAAKIQGPHPRAFLLLFGIVAFFVVAFFWSKNAVLDEVTRGDGKVIPSSQVQIIQNLEGAKRHHHPRTESVQCPTGGSAIPDPDPAPASATAEARNC